MAKEKHYVSTRGDADPEDEYNALDNLVVGRDNMTKARYRKHLTDTTSQMRSKILEEAFEDGKYKGEKVNRRDIYGSESESESESDISDISDVGISESDLQDVDSEDYSQDDFDSATESTGSVHSDIDEEEQLKREMERLKHDEERTINIIEKRRVSDKQKGLHVQNQLMAWEALVQLEMQIHPLLVRVNSLEKPVSDRVLVRKLDRLGRTLQQFANEHEMSEAELHSTGRKYLETWHQQTIASRLPSLSSKSSLDVFKQDPWLRVDSLWSGPDRERILAKKVKIIEDNSIESYTDEDFHNVLVKEWINARSMTGDTVAFVNSSKLPSIDSRKKAVQGRVSKGRQLAYDPHPKLIAYLMPRLDPNRWSDEKIDDLVNSLLQ